MNALKILTELHQINIYIYIYIYIYPEFKNWSSKKDFMEMCSLDSCAKNYDCTLQTNTAGIN